MTEEDASLNLGASLQDADTLPSFSTSSETARQDIVQAPVISSTTSSASDDSAADIPYDFLMTLLEGIIELQQCDTIEETVAWIVELIPQEPALLSFVGTYFYKRFQQRGELVHIQVAVATQQWAVNMTPKDDTHKASYLDDLGNSLSSRFERLGELTDIERAINAQRQAVELTPNEHDAKAGYLNNLGNSLLRRFDRLGELADLDSALGAQGQAVELTPEDHADKTMYLSNFGASLLAQFTRLGEQDDIDNAISAQRHAVELAPEGHAGKGMYLNNLGNSLQARFKRLKELADIDNAISAQRKAVELTSDGHPNKAIYLNNLGISFQARAERLGEMDDFDSAIRTQHRAVELIPQDHADTAAYLSNLGDSFAARFERSGELSDIDSAIRAQQKAVDLSPEGHARKAARLNNLGNSFRTRFERSGDPTDLDSAISAQRQAIELTPEDHMRKAGRLNSLGNSHRVRFGRLGELSDLDNAIDALRQSVELTPEGHASKTRYLDHLGRALVARFLQSEERVDFDAAIDVLKQSASNMFGPPSDRFSAARGWASLLSLKYSTASPLGAYKMLIELMPRMVWLGSRLHRRYGELPAISAIANQAAAAAIAAGDLACALEWLEEGRCIVWGQILQLRTPLDDVRNVDPKLADRLELVSHELESAGTARRPESGKAEEHMSLEDEAQTHRRLAEEYEALITKARTLPGCEGFLRPKKLEHLRGVADSGPVVVVNIDAKRCDALILRRSSGDVLHVPLPALSRGDATHWQGLMFQSLHKAGVRARGSRSRTAGHDKMSPILAKLWWNVVHPVLLELKFLGQNIQHDCIPHITWCTTGPLAFLPLHAAGLYDKQGGPKIFEHVVSSYTPTLTALLETGKHRGRHLHSIPSILAVSQPATPGQYPLPGTVTEVAAVQSCVGNMGFRRLNGEEATKDAVLGAMAEHSWIHLACHATQHTGDDPTKSAFLLHDGGLELLDIMKRSFKHTELAVLSACQTAAGAEKLPEEAVHLAAGMLMAGYPSVIATMWSIKDRDAPLVAEELYSRLMRENDSDRPRKVAYALHDAVKSLRDKVGENAFVRWVPFIHIGI